jgi:hypothetical protein
MPQLTTQENSTGFSHFLRFTYEDLKSSSYLTSSEKIVALIPPGGIVTNAAVVLKTAAGTATDITLSVGTTSGTATNLVAQFDLDAMTKVVYNTGSAVDTEPGLVNNTTAAVPIYAKFGGTLSSLTAGEWGIGLTILDPDALVQA